MRSALHRLTVCCLVAIYGLVGLTGESLQYMADDASHWLTNPSKSLAATGYYHSHGPGGHRHFHRHAVDSKPEVAQNAGTPSHPDGSFRSHRAGHLDHDCPLLSAFATLKLGHVVVVALQCDADQRHECIAEQEAHCDSQSTFHKLARGPPILFLA